MRAITRLCEDVGRPWGRIETKPRPHDVTVSGIFLSCRMGRGFVTAVCWLQNKPNIANIDHINPTANMAKASLLR